MPGVTVKVLLQDIKKLESEALIVGFHEDVRPLKGLAGELDWLLCGSLSSLIINHNLRGSLGDAALFTSRGKVPAQKVFLVGLGPREGFSPLHLRRAARAAVSCVLGAGAVSAAMEYFAPSGESFDAAVPALTEGFAEGAGGRPIDVTLLAPDATAYEAISRLVRGRSMSV